ncbi:MAG: protein translocase subunit SecD [Verrucomicrobia bacterium]|nr:protein translocase subunit SecD [Verrucomicrobiota bacterium]
MNRNLFWKFIFVVFVLAWSLWEIYPPTARPLLSEFESRAVNRDTNFTAIVEQARKLEQASPTRSFRNLRQAIGTNDGTKYFPSIDVKAEKDAAQAILYRLQQDAAGKIKLGLDLQGGSSYLVRLDTSKLETNRVDDIEKRKMVLSQAVEVLRKRVDKFGVAEPIITPVGEDSIEIQLPGLSEAEKESARAQIETAAYLEFRLVHPESDQLIQQGLTAPGYEVLQLKNRTRDGQEISQPFLVKRKPEHGLTGNFVSRAGVVPDPITNQPEISLAFNNAGAEIFGRVTRENVGRLLAIVLDGELYSAPRINEPIPGGNASISGQFTVQEAYDLANILENPLETPVKIHSEISVDPSLGADSIRSGINASLYGTIAVGLFMVIFYFFGGLVANLALLLNMVITLGVMCSIESTLTLPGIAGFVLSVGMAVDANVLIFERIREELAAGKSLRGALAAGYNRAFGTIFDSHVTTLISAIILIIMGTGPIKGFGVTLTIGVAASLFTALVVTRLIFDFLLARNLMKSLPMMPILRLTKIDFMGWTKPAFALSIALIVGGLGYGLFVRGEKMLGVDFKGGDALMLEFTQRVEVDKLRDVVTKLGVGEPTIQYQKPLAGTERETLRVLAGENSDQKIEEALKKEFPQAGFKRVGTDKIGATVGKEIQRSAIISSLLAMLGILFYVAFRYEFSFAVAAVVATAHDALLTIGVFALAGGELSSPIMAAILTIIGYSINDKIVILDRIREDLKLGVRSSFRDLINLALNQTLSRTLITGGSVILATLSLYVFGGGVIHDFAFTFLVGVLAGTYSSIFIACPVLLWWHKGERPRFSSQVVMDNAATARV